jgi:hypothetical protein
MTFDGGDELSLEDITDNGIIYSLVITPPLIALYSKKNYKLRYPGICGMI